MQTVQNDPSKSALLVKDFILQGTDPIADLYHKSVSNGRLNLYNSLCELENYFDGNNCMETEAVNLQIDNIQFKTNEKVLSIQFQLEGETYLKFRLIDITGRLINEQHLPTINTGKHQFTLSTKGLLPGIYYTIVNTKRNALSQPILLP